jgi:hypothetical protein
VEIYFKTIKSEVVEMTQIAIYIDDKLAERLDKAV